MTKTLAPLKTSIAVLIAALALSACLHTPAPTPTPKPRVDGGAKRGGGYYKDDGPGDKIPDDLDAIPDAVPRAEPFHRAANRPYVVFGKTYVPDTRLRSFRQRGTASWYGKKFHGRKTSIGEPYDMFAMTAAHPTLALPSYARVTNVANGKSVVVRVIDRGPFHASRVIDLSYAAAYRLGYINAGSALVEVESLLPGSSAPPPAKPPTPPPMKPPVPVVIDAAPPAAEEAAARTIPPPAVELPEGREEGEKTDEADEIEALLAQSDDAGSVETLGASPTASPRGGIFLQLGAFSSTDNAENFRLRLAQELDWLTEEFRIIQGDAVHRVQIGPYPDRASAEKVARKIKETVGYSPSFVNDAP
ncbi:MAG: septal ring lytic transglycosylase RlpA family protein [Candidatus Accumulibacter sp.]|jgi:rare lipoprotein A|nr:septal ring lytic transglycosylase RlpA family protein [Accumulibacter sp.]